jgi:hypothetical protein
VSYFETHKLDIAAFLLCCECDFPEVVFKTAGDRRATFRFPEAEEGQIYWFIQSLEMPPADGGPWVEMPKLIEYTRQLKDAIIRAKGGAR